MQSDSLHPSLSNMHVKRQLCQNVPVPTAWYALRQFCPAQLQGSRFAGVSSLSWGEKTDNGSVRWSCLIMWIKNHLVTINFIEEAVSALVSMNAADI